jgi:hypothetical protein
MLRIFFIVSFVIFILDLCFFIGYSVNATNDLKGRTLPIPSDVFTPPNQNPVTSLSRSDISSGLELPKNLIIPPSCPSAGPTGGSTGGCPPTVGTKGPDIIIATAVSGATIYGIAGNDVMQCGAGSCKIYAGEGDNTMISGASSTAQFFGSSGNNIFIGGSGDTLMVGGKGNDQLYAGSGHDVMIGGGGSNYFDCGANGNGVIMDFNAKNGDTKAGNCKYVVTINTGVPALP